MVRRRTREKDGGSESLSVLNLNININVVVAFRVNDDGRTRTRAASPKTKRKVSCVSGELTFPPALGSFGEACSHSPQASLNPSKSLALFVRPET